MSREKLEQMARQVRRIAGEYAEAKVAAFAAQERANSVLCDLTAALDEMTAEALRPNGDGTKEGP